MSIVKGLPQELKADLVSLPDGVSQTIMRIVPENVSSIVSASRAISNADGAGTCYEISVPSTTINFNIPTASPDSWIDTAKSTISFKVKYDGTPGATAFASGAVVAALRSSAMSFFNRIYHTTGSGTIADDVPLVNLAHHHNLQLNMNSADMDSLALGYGFSYEDASANSVNRNNGHTIASYGLSGTAATLASSYYSYEFPLPSSVIGKFCKGMFPIGKLNKLTLSLQTDTTAPVSIRMNTATASATGSVSFTIDDLAINLVYVNLGPEASRLLGGGDSVIVPAVTHRVSQSTLPSGQAGQFSILMGLRGSSCRDLAVRCVENGLTTATSVNGIYDSKAPIANSINFFLNGRDRVPPNPLNNTALPASVYMRALHSSESFADRQFKYAGTPSNFLTPVGGTAPSVRDARYVASSTFEDRLASWTFAYPLQKISKSRLLDGVNLNNSASQFFEMNLQNAHTNACSLYFIAELDIIFVIQNGDIVPRV